MNRHRIRNRVDRDVVNQQNVTEIQKLRFLVNTEYQQMTAAPVVWTFYRKLWKMGRKRQSRFFFLMVNLLYLLFSTFLFKKVKIEGWQYSSLRMDRTNRSIGDEDNVFIMQTFLTLLWHNTATAGLRCLFSQCSTLSTLQEKKRKKTRAKSKRGGWERTLSWNQKSDQILQRNETTWDHKILKSDCCIFRSALLYQTTGEKL